MGTAAVRMTARAAARRALLRAGLNGAALALVVASAALILLSFAEKLNAPLPPWPVLAAAAPAIAILAGLDSARRHRLSQARAARELDARLRLQDRLGTALALEPSPGPFERLAIEDAERRAASVNVAEAVALSPGWTWYTGPALLALSILGFLYLPDLAPRPSGPDRRAERRDAAQVIKSAAEAISAAAGPQPDDPQINRELEAVRELEAELASGTRAPSEARADGARSVERIADRFEQRADLQDNLAQHLRETLSRAAQPAATSQPDGRDGAGPDLQELSRSLRQGDLTAAEAAVAEAARTLDRMSPAEREALASELRSLARRIDAAQPVTPDDPPSPQPTSAEAGDPGASPPESGEPPSPANPDAAPNATPPQTPDKGASQPEPAPSEVRERQRRQLEDLKRDLENAAREAEAQRGDPQRPRTPGPDGQPPPSTPPSNPPTSTQPGEKPSPEEKPAGETAPPGDSRPEANPSPSSPSPRPGQQDPQRTSASKPAGEPPTPSPAPQSQPGQTPEPKAQPQPGSQPPPADQPQPGSQSPTGSQPQPGSQSQTGERGSGSRQPESAPQSQPGQPTQADGPAPGPPEGKPPAPAPGGSTPGEEQRPGPESGPGQGEPQSDAPKSAMERLARRLGEAQRLADQARQDQNTARQLRRRAEELLNRATPEERQRLEELARQLGHQPGGPTPPDERAGGPGAGPRSSKGPAPSEPGSWDGEQLIDARPKVEPGELSRAPQREAARWTGDAPARGDGPATTASPRERARQAARGLERAIEQQAVPAPYADIVRRVQRRYAQRATAPPAPGAAPGVTPDAPDAGGHR